jgi:hypothetical protein
MIKIKRHGQASFTYTDHMKLWKEQHQPHPKPGGEISIPKKINQSYCTKAIQTAEVYIDGI